MTLMESVIKEEFQIKRLKTGQFKIVAQGIHSPHFLR